MSQELENVEQENSEQPLLKVSEVQIIEELKPVEEVVSESAEEIVTPEVNPFDEVTSTVIEAQADEMVPVHIEIHSEEVVPVNVEASVDEIISENIEMQSEEVVPANVEASVDEIVPEPIEILSEEVVSANVEASVDEIVPEHIEIQSEEVIPVELSDNLHFGVEDLELEAVEDLPDFANLSKEELLKVALKANADKEILEALHIFKIIKPYFDHHIALEKEQALSKFIEEGGDKDGFEFKGDGSKEQFNQAYNELKHRKEEARKRQEEEKLENLKKKEAILEDIKKLTELEETEHSLKRLKELQGEWKKIKNVPKDQLENLWESYRVLNEIFYDRLSIYYELKELDRSKNLDHKIELISRVSELVGETNVKKALINIKKIQEEWRNIGPVPKEASEDLWARFKAESDKVYTFIKAKTEEMEIIRQQNLAMKLELLSKAKEIAETKTTRIKEWMDRSNATNELMEAWKKIGHVPLAMRDQIWNEFRDARNTFYTNKNAYFKVLQVERNANLKLKEAFCEKAETIAANPIDWNKQTDELKKLQEDWKKIGQAPDKVNDAIWRRFRTACDSFFTKKSERYAILQQEQLQNLETKNALIAKLEEMLIVDGSKSVFADLKNIQADWNNTGYVPAAQKDAINNKYNDLLDKLYGKNKQLSKEMRDDREKQNLEYLANSPNGAQKLLREEKILQERIKGLKKDIETWDNNLGFFKMGNNKNPLAEQINSKIEIAKKHIVGLEDKLKALKALRNKPAEPVT